MDEGDDVVAMVAEVGRRLKTREGIIVEAMSAMMATDVQGLDQDPDLVVLLYGSVEGNISTIFHILINDISLAHLQPTTAAVEYAIRLAQRGVPSHSLRRAYHVGQATLMEDYFVEVQQLDCSAELKVKVLHKLTSVASAYIDWITQYVADAYDTEWKRRIAAGGNMVSSLVNRLLDGQSVNEQAFATETGYQLDQFHIGAVLWLPEGDFDQDAVMSLEHFVQELARIGQVVTTPIFIALEHNLAWAWFARGTNQHAVDMAMVRALAAKTPGRIALGLPQHGVEGFRRTHVQALAARSLALQSKAEMDSAISFGDPGVAIVSALSRDLDATRAWVREQLGPLAANTPAAARLRHTLHTFMSTGRSYTESAALLNLHRNSVKYRIEKAVQERGRPLDDGRLDLELALQVCHVIGAQVL